MTKTVLSVHLLRTRNLVCVLYIIYNHSLFLSEAKFFTKLMAIAEQSRVIAIAILNEMIKQNFDDDDIIFG